MKKVSLGLLLLVGCVSYVPPQASFVSVAPGDSGDLYACAMRQLMTMEYTIDDADRESGWVRARKKTSGGSSEFWLGTAQYGSLAVMILDDEDGRTMRVTASSITEGQRGVSRGQESAGAPIERTIADARAIVGECT